VILLFVSYSVHFDFGIKFTHWYIRSDNRCFLFQGLGDQNGNGTIGLPVSDTSNNSNHSEDVDGNSGDILSDPNLASNFLQYVEPGEQNSLMLNGNMISNANAGYFLNNFSPSDGFLELKDFADAANLDCPVGNESTVCPSDGWAWKTPDSLETVNGANNDIPPLPDDQIFQPDELEQLLQSIQEDSHFGSSVIDPPHSSITNSVMPEDDSLMFYDAPFDSTMCDDGFRQVNGILNSPATNLSGIGMVDDGMPYYDAMDDNLFNDILGNIQQSAGSSHAFNGPVLTQEVCFCLNQETKLLCFVQSIDMFTGDHPHFSTFTGQQYHVYI